MRQPQLRLLPVQPIADPMPLVAEEAIPDPDPATPPVLNPGTPRALKSQAHCLVVILSMTASPPSSKYGHWSPPPKPGTLAPPDAKMNLPPEPDAVPVPVIVMPPEPEPSRLTSMFFPLGRPRTAFPRPLTKLVAC